MNLKTLLANGSADAEWGSNVHGKRKNVHNKAEGTLVTRSEVKVVEEDNAAIHPLMPLASACVYSVHMIHYKTRPQTRTEEAARTLLPSFAFIKSSLDLPSIAASTIEMSLERPKKRWNVAPHQFVELKIQPASAAHLHRVLSDTAGRAA